MCVFCLDVWDVWASGQCGVDLWGEWAMRGGVGGVGRMCVGECACWVDVWAM
jgi:hypothetical protein